MPRTNYLPKRPGLRERHGEAARYVILFAIVAVVVVVAVLVLKGEDYMGQCDQYGNQVYDNGESIYVIEDAQACMSE